MQFQILGGLAVEGDDGPLALGGRKQRAVLAALLVELGRSIPPDRLADQVWGEDLPGNPEASLQAYVSNLRRVLEPGRRPREAASVLLSRPGGYALAVDRTAVDAARFEDLTRAGHDALTADRPADAVALLDEALVLWGPPLPEWVGDRWADVERARLEELHAQAQEDRFAAGLALGDHLALVARIERAVVDHPYREALRGQLALALYRSGRQRDALAALADARSVLAEDIGIDPGRDLQQLEARIHAQDPALDLAAPARSTPPAPVEPPAADAPTAAAPVAPGPPTSGAPFVGRSSEVDAIVRAAHQVASGAGGRAVVVSGEPGIGKTRLVEEAVARVPELTSAWGRCPEMAGAAAFWTVAQIGRQLEGGALLDPDLLGRLLPEDAASTADVEPGDRLALHADVVRLLAGSPQPLLLVVDDLQWADPASLRILEFVAGDLRTLPVLLVVTVRPIGPDAPAALVDCLGELARSSGAVRIDLTGLDPDAVHAWLEAQQGEVAEDVAAEVHARTGGNPFFVGEVLALGAEERGSAVPPAVQDVVRRRIGRLPAPTQRVLSTASVVGQVFDLDVLAAVLGTSLPEVLDLLDPAWEAGLLLEADQPGRAQFSHALVAETLLAELTLPRRARHHAAVATALAEVRALSLDEHLADLAHHALEGATAGTAPAAHRWAVAAAQQAMRRGAPEDAARHWRQALQALALAAPGDREAAYEAQLGLARAHVAADQIEPGFTAMVAAIELAEQLGDVDRMAAAAVAAYVGGYWQTAEVQIEGVDVVGALERVVAAMPDEPSTERALILGGLSDVAYWHLTPERIDQLSAEGVAAARGTGDPRTLGRALHKRSQAMWRAATLAEREEAAAEALEVAASLPDDLELAASAHLAYASARWEAGVAADAIQHTERSLRDGRAASSSALIFQAGAFLGNIKISHGELREGLALLDEAEALYRRTRRWSADTIFATSSLYVWAELERQDLVDTGIQAIMASPYAPWFGEAAAWTLAHLGRRDEALAMADHPMPPLVDSWMYFGVLGLGAEARAQLGLVDELPELRALLAPYQGRMLACGTGPLPGDVDLTLAIIDRGLGDLDRAREEVGRSVTNLRTQGLVTPLCRALGVQAEVDPSAADAALAELTELVARHDLPLQRRLLAQRGL